MTIRLTTLTLVALLGLLQLGCPPTTGGLSRGAVEPTPAELVEPVKGVEIERREVRFSSAPAERYGEPVAHELGPVAKRIVALLTGAGLEHDPALSKVCREVARTAPDSHTISGALVDAAMDWAGRVAPTPQMEIFEISDPDGRCSMPSSAGGCDQALMRVAERALSTVRGLPALTGAGTAPADDGNLRIIIAIQVPRLQIEPIPATLAEGESLQLRGRVLGGRIRPELEIIDAEGRHHSITPAGGGGSDFAAPVQCSHGRGGYQVEVMAEGVHGPEMVANFRIYCGVPPPQTYEMMIERLADDLSLSDVARAVFQLLNETRRSHGLEALSWSSEAAAVAQAHSEEMAARRFVGHRSPTTGDVDDRFQSAGLRAALIRENIAHSYGPHSIHEGLMSSPGHRVNILSPDVTQVGIGTAWGQSNVDSPDARRPILLTQNFFLPRGADIPENPLSTLRQRVDAARVEAGLPQVAWSDALSQIAQGLSEGAARGRERQARARYTAGLQASGLRSASTRVILVARFADIVELDLWSEPMAGTVGVGIARVPEGEDRDRLTVTITVGQR